MCTETVNKLLYCENQLLKRNLRFGISMMEKGRRSIRTRRIILIILCMIFIPVSFAWYGTLEKYGCGHDISERPILAISYQHGIHCDMGNVHWLVFFGINGIIYGVPSVVVLASLRKNRL